MALARLSGVRGVRDGRTPDYWRETLIQIFAEALDIYGQEARDLRRICTDCHRLPACGRTNIRTLREGISRVFGIRRANFALRCPLDAIPHVCRQTPSQIPDTRPPNRCRRQPSVEPSACIRTRIRVWPALRCIYTDNRSPVLGQNPVQNTDCPQARGPSAPRIYTDQG